MTVDDRWLRLAEFCRELLTEARRHAEPTPDEHSEPWQPLFRPPIPRTDEEILEVIRQQPIALSDLAVVELGWGPAIRRLQERGAIVMKDHYDAWVAVDDKVRE